jgi:hypothetical protein
MYFLIHYHQKLYFLQYIDYQHPHLLTNIHYLIDKINLQTLNFTTAIFVPVFHTLVGKTSLLNKRLFLKKRINWKEKVKFRLPSTIIKDESTRCLFKGDARHYSALVHFSQKSISLIWVMNDVRWKCGNLMCVGRTCEIMMQSVLWK